MIRRLAPIVAAGLVLAACGSSDEPSAASDAPVESDAPTPTSGPASTDGPVDAGSAVVPAEVPDALQFSAPLLGGGDIEMATLAGRPVLLWFWSPW